MKSPKSISLKIKPNETYEIVYESAIVPVGSTNYLLLYKTYYYVGHAHISFGHGDLYPFNTNASTYHAV